MCKTTFHENGTVANVGMMTYFYFLNRYKVHSRFSSMKVLYIILCTYFSFFIAEAELRKPKIKEALQDTETKRRDKTVFSCVITGDPTPEVTWFFEGKAMKPKDFEKSKIEITSDVTDIEDGLKECKYSLIIPKSKLKMERKYQITCRNKY